MCFVGFFGGGGDVFLVDFSSKCFMASLYRMNS